jgi:hypothetical protein
MLGIEPPKEPHWALTSLPDDFPKFVTPRRWGLGGQEFFPDSAALKLYVANFCERQAQETAAEFGGEVIQPADQDTILWLVYDSWKSGLFINEAERVWVVKRTARILGWDCPQSVFESRTETHGKH